MSGPIAGSAMVMDFGWKQVHSAMDAFVTGLDKASVAALDAVAEAVRKEMIVQASGRPGPRVQSGTLRRSIHKTKARKIGDRDYVVQVGASAVYARALDQGVDQDVTVPAHTRARPARVNGALWDLAQAGGIRGRVTGRYGAKPGSSQWVKRHALIRQSIHAMRAFTGDSDTVNVSSYTYHMKLGPFPFAQPAVDYVTPDVPEIVAKVFGSKLGKEWTHGG